MSSRKVKVRRSELLEHLRECAGFINASSEAFDSGRTGEAKRLAVTVRVLLHDTKHSRSLLGQLGWKSGHNFYDTAIPYDPRNLMAHHGLVGLRVGTDGAKYHAPLGDGPPAPVRPYKFVKFPDWWNKPVIVDSRKSFFNRRDLVLALANKDGGAHIDPELDEAYVELTRNNSVGWVFQSQGNSEPIVDVERYSMRQIAYEVAASIDRLAQKHAS